MEFPRHVHKADGLYVLCPDEASYDGLKARGWADLPPAHVEQPVEVRLYDALLAKVGKADDDDNDGDESATGISALSVKDAEDLIAAADAEQLEAIKAEEMAGKKRKGVLALIDLREADLIGD